MHIYIPTLSRVGRVRTLDALPPVLKKRTFLVVREDQVEDYAREYGEKLILPCPKHGIAATRQWVMENPKGKYVCFLDDDLDFHRRTSGIKLRKCSDSDMVALFRTLRRWLSGEGFPHVGVSRRGGNNCVTAPWEEITRMNNVYAFDVEKFHESGARFDRLEVMEDFDVTLTMLRAGYPNRVSYEWAWGQPKSGAPGGCADYRTAEMQRKAAFALARLHPGVVTVKAKKSKTAWEGIGNIRTDVVIHWKKAYRPKRSTKVSIKGFFNNG